MMVKTVITQLHKREKDFQHFFCFLLQQLFSAASVFIYLVSEKEEKTFIMTNEKTEMNEKNTFLFNVSEW